jgi:hypothetical protein
MRMRILKIHHSAIPRLHHSNRIFPILVPRKSDCQGRSRVSDELRQAKFAVCYPIPRSVNPKMS